MDEDHLRIVKRFLEINNDIEKLKRKLVEFKGGILLSTNSVRLIDAIGENPDSNITQLSKVIGVTRSAVSQQVLRLVKEDFVIRYKDGSNNKEWLLKLDEKGRKVYKENNKLKSNIYDDIMSDLKDYTQEDINKFGEILEIIELNLNKHNNFRPE